MSSLEVFALIAQQFSLNNQFLRTYYLRNPNDDAKRDDSIAETVMMTSHRRSGVVETRRLWGGNEGQ